MHQDYLLTFHEADIVHILQDEIISKHFAININFIVLYEHQPKLVVELLQEPEKSLEDWDQATVNAQMTLLEKTDTKSKLKYNVHCRIYHLPGLPEVCRTFFPSNDDAGKFLQVSGTVMSISPVKLLQYQRSYICVKCKYPTLVLAEYERKYFIKQPKKCGNPEICSGTNFLHVAELDSDNCKDFQQIKIQEQIKKLGVGSMPNTMWVTLEDDLVDSCKPGDNVTISGIVKRRWGEFSKGSIIDIDTVLKANNIQVDSNTSSISASTTELQEMFYTFWNKYSEDPLAGRDLILKSICPQIYGLYLVKLALATVLAGGCSTGDTTFTGVCTRSESHLLLVGDPGTGKSELLRFVAKIIPRSVLTTGVGSTAAGLTVAAVMEHGEWQLEGGALVMSDGGVCCIDEFNSMKEHDRTSIHEAMEQQTISVAKASIVCKLNTRCTILAACNPKGNLDPSNPLCMNVALPSPLLSRFDLTLLLRDTVNDQWDTRVADHILNGRNKCSKLIDNDLWTIDILQSYFITIKKLNPKLSENAETILSKYYQMQRKIESRNKARTTVRLLESLIRLSQGHARLMFHKEVEVIDSVYAVVLVDTAMDNVSSILNLNITTRSTFLEWPLHEYCSILETVLNKLQIQDVLQKQIELVGKNKEIDVMSRFFSAQVGKIQKVEHKEQMDSANNVTTKLLIIQSQDTSDVIHHEQKRKIIGDNSHKSNKKLKKGSTVTDKELNIITTEYDTVSIESNMQNDNKNEENKSALINQNAPSIKLQTEHMELQNVKCSTEEKELTVNANVPSSLPMDYANVSKNSYEYDMCKRGNDRSLQRSVLNVKDLKKFKYKPRNYDNSNKVTHEIHKIDKPIIKDDSVFKNNFNNFVKDDLEMLKLIPNDNIFNIDLDFD